MDQVDQTIDSPPPQPPPQNGSIENGQATRQQEDEEPLPTQKSLDSSDSCNNNPEFAVICSFIAHFGDKLELDLKIEQLESSIEDQEHLDESLIELHVKLLKKIRRYFIRDQWLKTLIKFVAEYSWEDANELQTFGYLKTRPSVKLEILRRLMDAQFEHDTKFKAAVNSCEARELRLLPIGRDIKGNAYWQRTDQEGKFRIFQEQPFNYKSWKTVCSSVGELETLIEDLDKIKDERIKGEPFAEPYNPYPQIFPEYFTKEEEDEEKEQQDESQPAKSRATKSRKGRGGRGKTKKPLSILKEADEEKASNDLSDGRKSNNLDNDFNIPKPSQSNLQTSCPITATTCNGTIESQVRATLDSLISRVVSSFDYFIRPLSRNSNEKPSDESKQSAPKSQPRKRQTRKKERPAEELPRRSSSRIQQLQQKKIAEQENELKKMIESNTYRDTQHDDNESNAERQRTGSESPEQTGRKASRRKKKGEATWRRGKGKKKLSWDRDDSDLSSTSSLTESNNEDDLDDEPLQFESNNYDDEFACEEEDTNIEPVIIKRARTARQSLGPYEPGQDESTIIEEDKPCGRCDKSNDPEWILLCDKCDDGYHTACCLPPLMIVPDGDWFCAACEHKMLLEKLIELCNSIKATLEAKERERVKRQRLRQPKISKDTASIDLPTKRPRDVLEALNEPLAIQALDEELSDNESRGSRHTTSRNRYREKTKQRRTKRRARGDDSDDDDDNFRPSRRSGKSYRSSRRSTSDIEDSELTGDESESSQSEDEPRPKTRRARASVSYRFKEYDELIKSAIQGDSYEEGAAEDQDSGSEACNYGRGKDMATIEAIAYQQENGLVEPSAEVEEDDLNVVQGKNRRARKKSRRLNDLDADSETDGETSDESFQASTLTEAEEEEDEELTEVDSQDETSVDEILIPTSSRKRSKKGSKRRKRRNTYESDGSDFILPRTTRRAAARKQVSYKESTDDDDEFFEDKIKKSKKSVLESDAESEASWAGSNTKEDADNDDVSTSIDSPNTITGDGDLDEGELDEATTEIKTEEKPNSDLKSPVPEVPENNVLNESADELVKLEKQPAPPLSTQPFSIDEPARKQVQSVPMQYPEKMRDPIQELNQYCLDTAQTQTTMFSSYNETLSSKNVANSPPRPRFYDDDESSPVTPDVKLRKSKKIKTYSGLRKDNPSQTPESSTKTPSVNLVSAKPQVVQQSVITTKNGVDKSEPAQRSSIGPIPTHGNPTSATPANPRFVNPPVSSPMYAVPMQQPIARQPLPSYNSHMTKLPQPQTSIASSQPPQMSPQPYSPHFGSPMTQYMGQPRHNMHMSPYPNAQPPRPNLWPPTGVHMSPDRGSVIRQPMPQMYYPDPGAMPNPNFSIQQILSNPYGPPGFAQQATNIPPNPHGGMIVQPNLKSSPMAPNPLQPPLSSHASLPENPPSDSDNRSNADKDTIRGMSDVISFIGDT